MSWRRALSVSRKEIRHITRDRASFVLLMLSPVLFLVTMGYAFSIDIKNVSIAVLDQDLSRLSRAFVAELGTTDALSLEYALSSLHEVEQLLMEGRVRAAVVVSRGFGRDLLAAREPAVQIIVDGTDPNTAGHAIQHIGGHLEHFVTSQLGIPAGQASVIDLQTRAWYNPSFRYAVSIIPALIGIVLSVPAMAASLALARERELGTLEGLMATPIRRGELILGKLVPYVIAGFISVPLCILTAVYGYGVPFRGNLGVYLMLSVLFLLATMSISLFVSIFTSSQQVAIFASMLIFLFSGFFLSGLMIPFSVMGPLLRMEAMMFPTTHFVIISRAFFVKGTGLAAVKGHVLALVAIAVVFFGLAAASFKKKL